MTMSLNIKFSPDRRIKARYFRRMKQIIQNYFFRKHKAFQNGGTWEAYAIKFSGENVDKIKFMSFNKEEKYAVYIIKPFDKDSSWEIAIKPPEGKSFGQSFIDVLLQVEQAETTTEEPQQETEFSVNQFKTAKVIAHKGYGMEILIDERHKGFVDLSDPSVSESYDRNDLYKFPVGKIIRVGIADNKKEPYKCFIPSGIAENPDKNDVFTGIPNPDGHLELLAYTKLPKRRIEFLEAFFAKFGDKPAQKEEAYDYMIAWLKTKYNAKDVAKRGVVCIFRSLYTAVKWKPFLEKKGDHFTLTQEGLIEIGIPITSQILQKATETTEKIGSVLQKMAPEVKIAPIVEQQPSIIHPEPGESIQPTIDEVITYIRYTQRLVDISREREMLDKEINELTAWKNQNKHLETAAQKFFQATVKDGKNVLNEG
jgi:hypothetical protein